MGYQVGGVCYESVPEAAAASRWLLGHDTTLVLNGTAHLLQVFPVTDSTTGTRMNWKLTRMSDLVEVGNQSLTYDPPSCGTVLDMDRAQDLLELWALFIIPIILVWGGRKVYEFFDRSPGDANS